MRNCQKVMDMMLDYRTLAHGQQQYIEAHIADCSACGEEFATLQEFDSCFAGLRECLPSDFTDRVQSGIRRKQIGAPEGRSTCRILGAVVVAQLAAVACLQGGFRGFASGLLDASALLMRERVAPLLTGLGQTIVSEVGRVRLPSIPGKVNWFFVTASLIILVGFAMFTVYKEGRRHA